jgi:catechol 2,3-dioxygenase-like lactoylglutathione lyase family enzyme
MATVRYMVDDVDRALPFYQALGFSLVERPGPPVAIVRRGDLTLWLSGPGASARRKLDDGAEPAPGGWNRFVVEVDDLDAMLATLAAAGVRPRSTPVAGPGGRQALVMDASGNPVELFEARGAK